ncbi:MAG: hypothetical protein JO108_08545, partial [Acidobacteriaceae bacterium]|nr:hypothetical protein [Acidobacteriaceae bacterium]
MASKRLLKAETVPFEFGISGDYMEPEEGGGTRMQSRRDFAKRIGTALGGVALLGRGPSAFGQIPSGCTFYRVLNANDGQSYNGMPNIVADLTAAVMMGTTQEPGKPPLGYVYFHGTGTSQSYLGANAAAFLINLDYSVTPPKVLFLSAMAYEGQVLPVGDTQIKVGHLGTGASNSVGTYATTIEIVDTSGTVAVANTPGVYTWDPGTGNWSQPSYIGSDILTVTSPSQLQSAALGRRHRHGPLLLSTGQDLPGTSTTVRALGLVDVSRDGWFVAQTSSNEPVPTRDVRTRDRRLGTAL